MALPSGAYARRDPASPVLYQVVRGHYETFRVEAGRLRYGEGLPRFVEDEFEAFVRCGWLAAGFARFRCARCRAERLVTFSCKGRGFCVSCGGRLMTEHAAHLVDHVWPDAPVRQWVLTLPPRVRYVLAWRQDLCTAVAGVLFRAMQRHLCSWAGTRALGECQSGAVIVVQRFGGALNLNVHLHALVLDGVFARAGDGRLRFHQAPAPSAADVADVLATIVPRVRARLARVTRDGGRSGWATRAAARRTVRRPVRAPTVRTHGGRHSIGMQEWRSRATGRGWSACAGTSCGPPVTGDRLSVASRCPFTATGPTRSRAPRTSWRRRHRGGG